MAWLIGPAMGVAVDDAVEVTSDGLRHRRCCDRLGHDATLHNGLKANLLARLCSADAGVASVVRDIAHKLYGLPFIVHTDSVLLSVH